jgi:hypothetical protein
MRALKEWKEQHPELELDFYTNLYLHYIMASHSELFGAIYFDFDDPMGKAQEGGYDDIKEFTVDWGWACEHGIVKAWGNKTLGFECSVNKPYFLLTEEEKVQALCQKSIVMNGQVEGKPGFRKCIVLQLEAVSDLKRSFRREEWNRIVDMIPGDVAIFYMAPISWIWANPLTPRPNLIVLPGYPIGETAALSQIVDAVYAVHSGPMFLAYAVGARPIIQFGFNDGGPEGLLSIPEDEGENHFFPSNGEVNWDEIQDSINRHLA